MKTSIAWLPLAAVIGGLIGAWGPYEELSAYKDRSEVKRAQSAADRRPAFDPIAQFIKVPDAAKRPRREKVPSASAGETSRETPGGTNLSAKATGESSKPVRGMQRRKMLSPEDLQARIDEAAELWRTRVQLARVKALENLGFDESRADGFDSSIADMNDKLRESIQTLADMLAQEESMTPEMGVKLMGEMAVTLAETYDQIGALVEAPKRDKVSEMQLMEFIDPSVAEPLIAVKDKLGGRMFAGGRSAE